MIRRIIRICESLSPETVLIFPKNFFTLPFCSLLTFHLCTHICWHTLKHIKAIHRSPQSTMLVIIYPQRRQNSRRSGFELFKRWDSLIFHVPYVRCILPPIVHSKVHTLAHTHLHVHTHTRSPTHTHTHTLTHTHIYIYIYIERERERERERDAIDK